MKRFQDDKFPLGYAVAMTHRMQAAKAKEKVAQYGITFGQVPFLMEILRNKEPMTQDALSKALFIDPAATARAVEQLEIKGLVKRKVNPKNRRQKLVSATDKATWMKGDIRASLREAMQEVLEPLTTEEQETLAMLLSKICEHGAQT
ncbi:MarR family winged helix-turn-helix transcriptional regulator [Halodesulfovibrio marinisediminis]|uniref:DNA-binding transcriptional regulator, MarR family n=1 Tax=Halodesulfovibrio marinisediminis DSM 17456 TaxID=1121457 RepID=A0A1N6F851_9BACT|nr:MarR family transcriptional regulator [Halodesulfovibrio marinisediminis]SIN91453.1 DNA-binding transcriptional regulator, MarR family [Halodesulfovibrio marinisediminis DSM 17456]